MLSSGFVSWMTGISASRRARECKAMSHDDLLNVASGRRVSNTALFAVRLIRHLDGTCGTYVEADPDKSEMNGITVFEAEEGEDPEVVYRREAAE
jgi:hypothetical protein